MLMEEDEVRGEGQEGAGESDGVKDGKNSYCSFCDFSCKTTGNCLIKEEGMEMYCHQIHDAMQMKERFKHDKLTGAWSREYFLDVVDQMLKESDEVFQFIALDLDKFKYINEYYGRRAGDTVLKVVADRLLEVFGKKAAISHSYADKFYICVKKDGIMQEEIDYITTDKICLESGEVIRASIKMGIYSYDASSQMYTADECIDRALMARSTIKGIHGKNYAVYTTELEEKMREENEIESLMEKALKEREYVVFYQPKFSLSTGELVGAEALVRWNSKEKGMLSPGIFIPLFEKNGFIVKLDFYVYEEVCRFIRKILDENIDMVPISINVSRAHIETTDFVDRLIQVVDSYEIPHHYLEIEMTESTYGADNNNVIRIVNQLKEHGFLLSMDDFGSGYSSLNLLKNMPIDVLKIDKEFLGETETSKRSREIIRMIVEMSKAIDIQTICEGVETDQQAQFLRGIGCDMVQGFLFARPMPEESYLQVIRKNEA
jgi:diguanylate cyclase (GGDEF)-like protein